MYISCARAIGFSTLTRLQNKKMHKINAFFPPRFFLIQPFNSKNTYQEGISNVCLGWVWGDLSEAPIAVKLLAQTHWQQRVWRSAGFTRAPTKSTALLIQNPTANQIDAAGLCVQSAFVLSQSPHIHPININYTGCLQPIETESEMKDQSKVVRPARTWVRSSWTCWCFAHFVCETKELPGNVYAH